MKLKERYKISPEPSAEIPYRNILNANFDTKTRVVKLFYLFRSKTKYPLKLITVEGAIEETDISTANVSKWIDSLMDAAYDGEYNLKSSWANHQSSAGIPRSRHLLIFVNPYGGTVR